MAERHIAGHATHFLRRLDRASDTHVERALTLYRDAELLRETLSRAEVPNGAERVAISLAERDASSSPVPRRGHEAGGSLRRRGRNDACPCGSGKKYKRCCG
jgi:uncharacterized protein YecA (UPF0149 family)